MSEWQTMDSAPNEGCFLVWLDKPRFGSNVHTMRAGPAALIGCMFAFDLKEKPIRWMPLPAGPAVNSAT